MVIHHSRKSILQSSDTICPDVQRHTLPWSPVTHSTLISRDTLWSEFWRHTKMFMYRLTFLKMFCFKCAFIVWIKNYTHTLPWWLGIQSALVTGDTLCPDDWEYNLPWWLEIHSALITGNTLCPDDWEYTLPWWLGIHSALMTGDTLCPDGCGHTLSWSPQIHSVRKSRNIFWYQCHVQP